jgi:hypothetical protein
MDIADQLAARAAEQAARYAAARAAEAPQTGGSSRRKGNQPKKHVPGGAAAPAGTAAGGPAAAVAAKPALLVDAARLVLPTKHGRVKPLSVEALATAFYTSGSSDADARTRLQNQADAECRVRARESGKFLLDDTKGGRLTVTYRAVRHDIVERLQAITKEETVNVLVAVVRRATTSRRAGSDVGLRLITPGEQAARSSCVFWNAVRHFGSPEAAAEAASKALAQA